METFMKKSDTEHCFFLGMAAVSFHTITTRAMLKINFASKCVIFPVLFQQLNSVYSDLFLLACVRDINLVDFVWMWQLFRYLF